MGTSWREETPLLGSGVFLPPNHPPFPAPLRAAALRTRFVFCFGAISAKSRRAGKTFSGVARFRVEEAPPVRFFVKIASGRGKLFWVLLAFALGRHRPCGFSSKSCRDGENRFGWKPLLCWGSTTRAGFCQNRVVTGKTFSGVARFCVGKAPPDGVFVVPVYFCKNARLFRCPDAFSVKTRGVLLAPTCFLRKRAAFSSS